MGTEERSMDPSEGFSVLHAIPGRMRVRLPFLAYGRSYDRLVREALSQKPGITNISSNRFCASITVNYEPQIIAESELLELFSELAKTEPSTIGDNSFNRQKSRSFKDSIWNPWNLAGCFLVGLGVVAIFVPLLPTVPTLLLAGACYMKGSKRFYDWLMGHKLLGKYISEYKEKKGISPQVMRNSLILLWVSLGISIVFLLENTGLRIMLVMIGFGVSIHIVKLRAANH